MMHNMYEKYNRILDRFEQYYPGIAEQAVDWWPSGKIHITVKLEDGLLFEYDYNHNTIRRLRSDADTPDVDILKKDIGYNLQKVISARGIPQNVLAERTGLTPAMLSRYIHGTSLPGVDKLKTIASVLGCRVIDILGDEYEE